MIAYLVKHRYPDNKLYWFVVLPSSFQTAINLRPRLRHHILHVRVDRPERIPNKLGQPEELREGVVVLFPEFPVALAVETGVGQHDDLVLGLVGDGQAVHDQLDGVARVSVKRIGVRNAKEIWALIKDVVYLL